MWHSKKFQICLSQIKCDALPQNREQVTFWAKWVFGITVENILSAVIWYQNLVPKFLLLLLIEIWWFVYETPSSFSEVWFWESFQFKAIQSSKKSETAGFLWYSFVCLFVLFGLVFVLLIFQNLHGGDRRLSKVCKNQKSQNPQMGNFSTHANFNCLYLEIGPCNLFPVLSESITNVSVTDQNMPVTDCAHETKPKPRPKDRQKVTWHEIKFVKHTEKHDKDRNIEWNTSPTWNVWSLASLFQGAKKPCQRNIFPK